VVPAQEDRRYREIPEHWRLRELGVLEQSLVVGFLGDRCCIDDSRHQARDGIDHDARGDLAAGQHVVADRDLLPIQNLDRAVVDPLVASADDRDPLTRRQLLGKGLVEEPTTRRHDEDPRSGEFWSQGRLDCGDDWRGHHHHPGAATIGGAVDRAMTIVRPIADVVDVDLDDTAITGPPQNALVERTREYPGKEREDIESHEGVLCRSPRFRHEPRLRLAAASAGPSGSGALPRPAW
jgi:hypothetical protein